MIAIDTTAPVAAPPVWLASAVDPSALRAIERQLHLRLNKWDTQVGDVRVLCEHPLVLPANEWSRLCAFAEELAAEIERLEKLVLEAPGGLEAAGVPPSLRKIVAGAAGQTPRAARNMRFDFHPTAAGWRVSEVNTDVPGGWREGASLPELYHPFYTGLECPDSPLKAWGAVVEKLGLAGRVALLSAPGYLEDQQVLRTFGCELSSRGIACSLIQTPEALTWTGEACALAGSGASVSAVIRFYQLEWLCSLHARTGWQRLLESRVVPVLNPTISAISESKRFPLAVRESVTSPAWQLLLPECLDPRQVCERDWDSWVLKGCYSNTGDQVLLVGDLPRESRQQAIREARRRPAQWIAQRRFATAPLESSRGLLFPCVGLFVVGGRAAGAYVRLSLRQVTDGAALEAPLFIDRTGSL